MPRAWPSLAMAFPMFPKPTMPSFLPHSSVRGQAPAASASAWDHSPRRTAWE